MRPTRRAQPYRRGGMRPPGEALRAMLAGRTAHGYNPADVRRRAQRRRRLRDLL